MAHFALQTILLYVALCFRVHQGQELQEFLPTFLKVSRNLPLQRLLVEWDVSDSAHKLELQMVFDIQVSRTEEMNIVWTEYYSTTLSKLNKTLHWSWDSEVPLECTSHSVRIRSMVNEERFSKTWSCWSQWETVLGLDTSDDNTPYLFPEDKVVEEGSNVTFCCIGGKDKKIEYFLFNYTDYYYPAANASQRNMVITVSKVWHAKEPGILAFCEISGKGSKNYKATLLFVGKPPDEPKDLSCDTPDMNILTCTWNPGQDTYLYGTYSTEYHLFERVSNRTFCSQKIAPHPEPNRCSWTIDQQMIYNLTLTAQNPLGKRSVNFVLDVAHRVHPSPPSGLSVEHTKATEVILYWNMEPKNKTIELLCQIEILHPSGQMELHNTSVVQSNSYQQIIQGDLQPYTSYAFRMRCGAAIHFWKWSEWSKTLTVRTIEAAPSGKLDVWREVTPFWGGRQVTLFWKPSSDFRANGGGISFEITWEKLEAASEPEHISIPALQNSTTISIDNHSYKISIAARNNINSSLPSVIIVSRMTENGTEEKFDRPDLGEERVNGTDDGIYISWNATNAFDGYIVDWCNFPRSEHCDFQWKRFSFNTSNCLINSAFIPGVRYSFRVYGLVVNEAFLLGKMVGYTKELAPSVDPQIEVTKMTSHSVTLTWDSYPINESQPGFIRGYHVYVKPMEEECSLKGSTGHALSDGSVLCKYTVENPEEKRYMLKHLMPKTTYAVAVKAYSGGGETPIDGYINVDTLDDSKIYLTVLLATVLFVLIIPVCFWKSKWVESWCCAEIPNPNKSKVLSSNGLKVNSEVLKPSDCIADTVVLDNTPEPNILQPWNHETILGESESKVTNPCWVYFVQNEEVDLPCTKSAREACASFDNLTYSPQTALRSSLYQNLWMSRTSDPQLSRLLYQPQHYIEILSKDTVTPEEEITEMEDSLRYISQMDLPPSEFKLSNLCSFTEPMEHSSYKIQTVLGSELVTSMSDEDLHSENSSTSNNSAALLLPVQL